MYSAQAFALGVKTLQPVFCQSCSLYQLGDVALLVLQCGLQYDTVLGAHRPNDIDYIEFVPTAVWCKTREVAIILLPYITHVDATWNLASGS